MDAYVKKTGGQVLAIPHNGNLSNGLMYKGDLRRETHGPAYAEARASHEPLFEATQIKATADASLPLPTTSSPISSAGH